MIDTYNEDAIFTYHCSATPEDVTHFRLIREKAKEFALLLREACPPGRELAVARTKLEECVMWANAGIAREAAYLEVATEKKDAKAQSIRGF
jgi:hypothetical protein